MHQVPPGGLEPCPNCGRQVSFTSNLCPSCLLDRVNPDPAALAKWKAAQEHAQLAVSKSSGRAPIASCLALACYGLGLLLCVSGSKAKGHDAGLAVVGGMLFGFISVLLGAFFALFAAARKERPGWLPALAVAVPLGMLVVLLITRLI